MLQNLPGPTNYGYVKEGNVLQPKFMVQGVSAPELLNDLVCKCEDYCTSKCTCYENNQPCTAECLCGPEAESEINMLCTNSFTVEITANESDSN